MDKDNGKRIGTSKALNRYCLKVDNGADTTLEDAVSVIVEESILTSSLPNEQIESCASSSTLIDDFISLVNQKTKNSFDDLPNLITKLNDITIILHNRFDKYIDLSFSDSEFPCQQKDFDILEMAMSDPNTKYVSLIFERLHIIAPYLRTYFDDKKFVHLAALLSAVTTYMMGIAYVLDIN